MDDPAAPPHPVQSALPVDAVLPALLDALATHGRAVLQAPPGAGKTTRVPLALLASGQIEGRIRMLEPRRIAARSAAARMAQTLGEEPGQTIGYRMRGATRTGPETRIEVLTDGILARLLQADPALEDTGALIFDEFHERSLQADLGLALAWQARQTLRPDLAILVMSATLDAAPVAALLDDAPILTAEGRAYPVETHWLDAPLPRDARLEPAMADLIARAAAETEGGLLAFLPGEGEIRRTEAALAGRLPAGMAVRPLYGAMPLAAQRAAIGPAGTGRKLVLATAIAETALTIEDVRAVVDAGRARRPRFDPGSGMTRLVTEPVSRAEAEQRRGRAGRVAAGRCYRLWTRGAEGALPAFAPPEIAAADLTRFALELAAWGAEPSDLAFLTAPPEAAFAKARGLLTTLGALDPDGRITPHGRAILALPLHPRLAHMLRLAGPQAAPLAALLDARDRLHWSGADLAPRLAALRDPRLAPHNDRPALDRLAKEARRLATMVRETDPSNAPTRSPGALAALAYPDRVGLRRPGDPPRWLLASGKEAALDPADPLGRARLLVVTDTDGDPRSARIRQAATLTEAELRADHAEAIEETRVCQWSRRHRRIEAARQERFAALVLSERPWRDAPAQIRAAAALEGLRDLGLGVLGNATGLARLRSRLRAARDRHPALPDPDALLDDPAWILPSLAEIRDAAQFSAIDAAAALLASLPWEARRTLDEQAPEHWTTPLGRRVPVTYEDGPEVSLRLQEVLGLGRHPIVAGRALRLVLLSPAGRPVQVTTDLPGFWAGSYGDVRRDMRARYPKHDWPDDPAQASPSLGAKPRNRR